MNNKTENTEKFYDKLISEKNDKTFFSFDTRFEQNKILQKKILKSTSIISSKILLVKMT